MATELKARVKARVEALGISPITLAKSVGLERGFINDIVIGRKKGVRYEKLTLVAKALECDPRYLQGDIDTPWPIEAPATPPAKVEGHGLTSVGTCEAGVWRGLSTPPQPVSVPIQPDPRHPGAPQRAYRLEAYTAKLQNFPAYAVSIDADYYTKKIGPIGPGCVVVLRRVRRQLKETELTIRQVEKVGSKTQLADPGGKLPVATLESPPAGEALQIEAVVTTIAQILG